jgi:hypothetical protein
MLLTTLQTLRQRLWPADSLPKIQPPLCLEQHRSFETPAGLLSQRLFAKILASFVIIVVIVVER